MKLENIVRICNDVFVESSLFKASTIIFLPLNVPLNLKHYSGTRWQMFLRRVDQKDVLIDPDGLLASGAVDEVMITSSQSGVPFPGTDVALIAVL